MYAPTTISMPEAIRLDLLDGVLRKSFTPGPGGSGIFPFVTEHTRDMFADVGGFIHQMAVVGLWPSSQIVAHCDAPIRGIRRHVALQQNARCWSFSGGVWQQLALGHVYTMDPTDWHGAVNWGDEIRWHLMIDIEADQ